MTANLNQPSGLVEIPAIALRPGMYVADLDRPWLDTPFAMQGFMVNDDDDVEYVAKHCNQVFIDPARNQSGVLLPAIKAKAKDPVSIKSELKRAKVDFETATQAVAKVFSALSTGQDLNVANLQHAVNPLIESVFRNRDAMAALVRMKDKGDYFYNHAVANAVWCAVFGRHLGLEKPVLQELALGASMMDIGMTQIDDSLLNQPQEFSAKQRGQVQGHVRLSLKMIQKAGGASLPVMNMVACHHERYDGSGYPQGLAGKRIPKIARIAALVDSYDAMLTPRPHAAARSSFAAIQELVDLKDVHHQGALVEQFVQSVGMFPTGTLVELNTGTVGVVVAQNAHRRLRPQLVLVLDANKRELPQLQHLDLDDEKSCTAYDADARGQGNQAGSRRPELWIAQELQAGKYGICADDYFL